VVISQFPNEPKEFWKSFNRLDYRHPIRLALSGSQRTKLSAPLFMMFYLRSVDTDFEDVFPLEKRQRFRFDWIVQQQTASYLENKSQWNANCCPVFGPTGKQVQELLTLPGPGPHPMFALLAQAIKAMEASLEASPWNPLHCSLSEDPEASPEKRVRM
jgi:hypothetical protein